MMAFLAAFSVSAQKADLGNISNAKDAQGTSARAIVEKGVPDQKFSAEGATIKQNNHPKAAVTVLSETFNTGALPTGWTNTDNSTGGLWAFNNPGARIINTTTAADGFAIFDSDILGNDGIAENADLITPAVDCGALTSVKLSFEHYFKYLTGDTITLSVSGDNGATWTVLESWTALTANAEVAEYDITTMAAGLSQVKIKWNYAGNYSWYWAVDDVKIFQPATHDIKVTAITPDGQVEADSTYIPSVTVVNNGCSSDSSYSIMLSDGVSYSQTVTVTAALAPAGTYVASFPGWTPAAGSYTLTAIVSLALDEDSTNDTLTQNVSAFDTYWHAAADTIPMPVYLGTSCGYFNGTNHFLYSIGGNDSLGQSLTLSIYNIETETWSTGANLPAPSLANSAVTAGAYIYLLQGSAGTTATNSFFKYDIVANSWSTLANLPRPLSWTNLAEQNGNIYCVGGTDTTGAAVNTVYRYNITSNEWTTASPVASVTGLFGGSLVVADNKLVYIQGEAGGVFSGSVFLGEVNSTNPDTITWTNGTPCPTGGVYKIKADLWTPCSIIYTGGNDGIAGGYWGAVPYTYIYDVANDTWAEAPNKTMSTLAYAAASFNVNSETRYYVASGYNNMGIGQLKNVEYYSSPLTTDILTFGFDALIPAVAGTVDATNHTVTLTVPYGTDVTTLVPAITLPCGATINPLSGVAQNFTSSVIYTVTAQDGITTQPWTINVSIDAGISNTDAGEQISIYPIPANDVVYVKMNTNIKQIDLINLNGQVLSQTVLDNNENTINTAGLSNGIYFLRIETSNGVFMRKIQILKQYLM